MRQHPTNPLFWHLSTDLLLDTKHQTRQLPLLSVATSTPTPNGDTGGARGACGANVAPRKPSTQVLLPLLERLSLLLCTPKAAKKNARAQRLFSHGDPSCLEIQVQHPTTIGVCVWILFTRLHVRCDAMSCHVMAWANKIMTKRVMAHSMAGTIYAHHTGFRLRRHSGYKPQAAKLSTQAHARSRQRVAHLDASSLGCIMCWSSIRFSAIGGPDQRQIWSNLPGILHKIRYGRDELHILVEQIN